MGYYDNVAQDQLESGYQVPTASSNNSGGVRSSGILGFVQRNAPTIGGIAGGLLAAPLDPFTGGAASVVGAGIGGGLGQSYKNVSSGKSATNDLIGGALSGAEGEFGGKILGKVLGGTVGKAFKGVTNKIVDSAASKTANADAVANAAPFQGVSKNILQAGKGNDLNGTMNFMQNNGLTPTVENMHALGNFQTGANGVISGTTRQILGNTGQVSTDGIMQAAQDQLGKEGVHLTTPSQQQGVLASVRGAVQGIANKGDGTLSNTADANNLFDSAQALESRIRDLGGTTAQGANGAEARVLQSSHDAMMNNIGTAADKNVSDFKLAPQDEAAIMKNAPSPEIGQHTIDSINNATKLSQLRGAQIPAFNASKLATAADNAAGGVLPKAEADTNSNSNIINGVANAATGNHLGVARSIGNAVGDVATSAPVVKAATKASNLATTLNTGGVLGKVLGPTGTSGVAAQVLSQGNSQKANDAATNASSAPTTESSSSNDLTSVIPGNNVSSDGSQTGGTDASSGSRMTADQLMQLTASDPKNASAYLALYKTVGDGSATSGSSLTTNQKNEVVSQQKALDSLRTYAQRLQGAGGGSGPVIGAINGSILGNYTNPAAKALDSQRIDIASAIAGSLNPRGTVSPVTARLIADSLPTIHDSAEAAKNKLQGLVQQIQSGAFSADTSVPSLISANSGA